MWGFGLIYVLLMCLVEFMIGVLSLYCIVDLLLSDDDLHIG